MESMRIEILCENKEEVKKYLTWLPGKYREVEVITSSETDTIRNVEGESTPKVGTPEISGEDSLPFLMQAELKNSKSTKIWTCFRAIGGLISFIAAGIIFILDQLGILK